MVVFIEFPYKTTEFDEQTGVAMRFPYVFQQVLPGRVWTVFFRHPEVRAKLGNTSVLREENMRTVPRSGRLRILWKPW